MARYEINPFTNQMERVDKDGYVSPSITSDATLTLEQEYILVDASGGDITITLPLITPQFIGQYYYIKRTDDTANVVTVQPSGSDTVDGAANQNLDNEDDSIHIVATPGDWAIYSKIGLNYASYTKEPTGFLESNDDNYTTHDWDDGTKIYTLTHVQNFTVFIQGRRFYYTSDQTVDLSSLITANGHGTYFIYFDSDGVLQASATPWTINGSSAFVAVVYWDNTNSKGFVVCERHGCIMDWATHNYLHHTRGGQYDTGLALTYPTNDGDDGSLSLTAGDIHDEDIQHSLNATTTCSTWYRLDATNFTWDTPDSSVYKTVTGSIAYDNAGTPTAVSNNKYVTYYIIATNSPNSVIISIMGQAIYTLLSDAEEEQINDLTIGELPNNEFVVLYKVIYQQTAGGVQRVETFDLRYLASEGLASFTANDHGLLAGLADDDHTHYLLMAGRSGGQTVYGGTGVEENLQFSSTTNATKGRIIFGTEETGLVFDEDDETLTIGGGENSHTINGVTQKSLFEFHLDGNTAPGGITFHRHSNTATLFCPIVFLRSRGDHTTQTIVQDGDAIGGMMFTGFDGTDNAQLGGIRGEVDGTPGNDDMPGRIRFFCTPSGSQTPAEVLRLSQDKSALFAGAVTVQGAFTSIGIDDNCTGERLQLADGVMDLGAASTVYYVVHAADDQLLGISGGSGAAVGANIILYGSTHATLANDIYLRASGENVWKWDESVGQHIFSADTGAKEIVFKVGLDEMNLGYSGADYDICHTVSDQSLRIYGGNNSGANILLYGGTHLTAASDILLRSGGDPVLKWDDSVNAWYLYSGAARSVTYVTGVTSTTLGQAGTNYTFQKNDGAAQLYITGGSAWNLGATIRLDGESHANGDLTMLQSGNAFYSWDETAGEHKLYTGTGAKTLMNVYKENVLECGQAGQNYTIRRNVTDYALIISGGNAWNDGSSIVFYGSTQGGTQNYIKMRADGVDVYQWEEANGDHTWYSGTGVTKPETMVLTSAGRLGIGVAAPDTPLHVYHAATNIVGKFESGDAGVKVQLSELTTTWYFDGQADYMALGDSSISSENTIFITTSNTVGINEISPLATLHVKVNDVGAITLGTGGDDFVIENTNGAGMSIISSDANNATLLFGSPSNTYGGRIQYNYNAGTPGLNIGTVHGGGTLNLYVGAWVKALDFASGKAATFYGDVTLDATDFYITNTADGAVDSYYDANRSGAGSALGRFTGLWNGTTVGRITFATGADTINKDDGKIIFQTSAASGSLVTAMVIESDQSVTFNDDITVTGNLTVSGLTSYLNSNSIQYGISGTVATMWHQGSDGGLYIYGGYSQGAWVAVFGESHATRAGDWQICSDVVYETGIKYDHSLEKLTFSTNNATLALSIDSAQTSIFYGTLYARNGSIYTENIGAVNNLSRRWDINSNGAVLGWVKSRSNVLGTAGGIVADNDWLGFLRWYADDGTDTSTWGAEIRVQVDGTPGVDNVPAAMEFRTNSGAAAPVTNMTIQADGDINIANNLVVSSGFTCLGFTCTAPTTNTMTLENNALTLGQGQNFLISKDVEDDNLMISGGTAWNSGGGAAFFGTSHASAGDVFLRSSGTNFLTWDESAKLGVIETTTSDGSDTGQWVISGGGGDSVTRGGICRFYGNEHATYPGFIKIVSGNTAGADIEISAYSTTGNIIFLTNAGTTAGSINENQAWTINGNAKIDTGTVASSPAQLQIETANEASTTAAGDVYAALKFAVTGADNGTGDVANGVISAIKCIDFRSGDTSYEDAGLGFYTLDTTDATPVFRGGFSNNGGFSVSGSVVDVDANYLYVQGRIGIGVSAPLYKLHVQVGESGGAPEAWNDDFVLENAGTVGMTLLSPDANPSRVAFGSATDGEGAKVEYQYNSGNPFMRLGTQLTNGYVEFISGTGATQMTLDKNGRLTLEKGQLQFPATQNASTDVNTLDDYEEGSWTPVIGGSTSESGQSYSVQVGRYIKIGKLVHCQANVRLSAKGTITGDLQIKGLPFTAENTANYNSAAAFSYMNEWTLTSGHILVGHCIAGATYITLQEVEFNSDASAGLTTSNIENTTGLILSITYEADN